MTNDKDEDRTVRESKKQNAEATAPSPRSDRGGSSAGSLSDLPLEPGATLGRYELIECIDKGGMGVIYRARHVALGKQVALKVISTSLQLDPRSAGRFLREMQAIGRLDPHPNVLSAYDAGDEGGIKYIATELIEGVQIATLIRRLGPLSVSEACRITAQAARALDHLRVHHLVHRDIKPSNLMLTRDGTVKLVDMGLALLRDEIAETITISGETMGSIDYIAPEQWRDPHDVDWRSDVYSLGCTFYCLLAGRAPYADRHKGTAAKMQAHLDARFPDVRRQRSDVPEEVAELLSAMVEKDPDRRNLDLVHLAEELETIASGDLRGLVARAFSSAGKRQRRAVPALPPTLSARDAGAASDANAAGDRHHGAAAAAGTAPSRRHWARPTGIAVLLTALVIGLVSLVYFAIPDDRRASDADPTSSTAASAEQAAAEASPPLLTEPVSCIGHQAKVMDLVFLDSNSKIASVSADGMLCLFDLRAPDHPTHAVQLSGRAAASLLYDPIADHLLVACEDGSLRICSGRDGSIREHVPLSSGGFTSVARIPGAKAYVTGDWNGDVRRVDLSRTPVENYRIADRPEVVYDVDVSPDGSLIAWVGREPVVTLWDVAEQSSKDLVGHEEWIFDVAIAPNGQRMASAGQEDTVRLWRLPGGEAETSFNYVVPQALCFFPDSRHLAVGGRATTVLVWDIEAGRSVQEFSVGRPVDSVAVSTDGSLVAAGANDGTLKVWPISL